MTVAEQLEIQNKRSHWGHAARVLQVLISASVLLLAVAVVALNNKASSTADQASETATVVSTELGKSVTAICESRITTLRTAPQTIREIRAVIDANSKAARMVCPNLDYKGLGRQGKHEAVVLATGGDPHEIAAMPPVPSAVRKHSS